MEERNWGIYSGKPWSEVQQVLEGKSLDERYNYVPPGGESWKTFESRLIRAISQIINENPGDVIAFVTHGGSIRALMPHLLSKPKEVSFQYDFDNASITIFQYKNGNFVNLLTNSTDHLSIK